MIVLNSSWRGQRVTGQQRYAQEISRRLLREPGVTARPRSVPGNKWAAWLASQALAIPRGRETLLTLTSRGPLWHPRHVVVIHDHFVLTHPEWFTREYVATHAPVLRAQVHGARGLVFVSPATRDRHHEIFGQGTPYVIAPNGIELPRERPSLPRSVDGDYLLVVGSRDPRKNLRRLLRAYSQLPLDIRDRTKMVVAGGGDAGVFRNDLEADLDLRSVLLLGYVDEKELWRLYAHARALLVPSLDEGFGLPLIEAAALGTPLAVSDIPVFKWIAGPSATYFDPASVDSIGSALTGLLSQECIPPPAVIPRFEWNVSSLAILEFCQDLAGES